LPRALTNPLASGRETANILYSLAGSRTHPRCFSL
jgi:hypothetical protein